MRAINQAPLRVYFSALSNICKTVIRRGITVLLAWTLLSFNYVAHNGDRKFQVADLVALEYMYVSQVNLAILVSGNHLINELHRCSLLIYFSFSLYESRQGFTWNSWAVIGREVPPVDFLIQYHENGETSYPQMLSLTWTCLRDVIHMDFHKYPPFVT